jgi:hypothetical protein
MLTLRRALAAVTLRRVIAVLLLGCFVEAIASLLGWLVSIGWALKDVATLRAFLLAALALAAQAGLVYLALRGLGSLLDRRRKGEPVAIVAESALDERDPTVPLEEIDAAEIEAAAWPQVGGSDGRGREYY